VPLPEPASAVERGIHTFSASYLAENRPIAALVEDADGLGRQIIEHGIAEFSLALDDHRAAPARADQTDGGQPSTGGARPQPTRMPGDHRRTRTQKDT